MGGWVGGGESLLIVDSYCYLGIVFSSDRSWDKHEVTSSIGGGTGGGLKGSSPPNISDYFAILINNN